MLQQRAIIVAALNKPLGQAQTRHRHGRVIPILAASLSGLLFGLAVLWVVVTDHPLGGERAPRITGQQQQIVPAPQTAPAEVPPTAAAAAVVPTAKTVTVTVIDSQTGAKREVVLPASASDQPEDSQSRDNPVSRSTIPVTAAQTGRVLNLQREPRRADRRVQQLTPLRSGSGAAQVGAATGPRPLAEPGH